MQEKDSKGKAVLSEATSPRAAAVGTLFTSFKGVNGSLFVCHFTNTQGQAAIATARVGEGNIKEDCEYRYDIQANKWIVA